MNDRPKQKSGPPGGPEPLAKFILGAVVLVVVMMIVSWVLGKFEVWKWFR